MSVEIAFGLHTSDRALRADGGRPPQLRRVGDTTSGRTASCTARAPCARAPARRCSSRARWAPRRTSAEGLGNPASFATCQHGAGRAMSRTAARKAKTSARAVYAEMADLGVAAPLRRTRRGSPRRRLRLQGHRVRSWPPRRPWSGRPSGSRRWAWSRAEAPLRGGSVRRSSPFVRSGAGGPAPRPQPGHICAQGPLWPNHGPDPGETCTHRPLRRQIGPEFGPI